MPGSESGGFRAIGRVIVSRAFAWSALVFFAVLAVLAWWYVDAAWTARAEERFLQRAETQRTLLDKQFGSLAQLLGGAVGLLQASTEVSRAEWAGYVAALDLTGAMPGVRGIGYAPWLAASDKARLEARARAAGVPDYRVRTAGAEPWLAPVLYLENAGAGGSRLLGEDLHADPVLRDALLRARDSGGMAVAVGALLPPGEAAAPQPRLLLVRAVYRTEAPVATAAERLAALRGFVFVQVDSDALLAAVFGGRVGDGDVALYDGAPVADKLVYRSRPERADAALSVDKHLDFGGHGWTLRVRSSAEFEDLMRSDQPLRTLVGNLVASLVFFGVLLLNGRYHRRMLAVAGELATSRDRFRSLVENLPGAVFCCEPHMPWRILHVSRGIEALTGEPAEEFLAGRVMIGELIHPDDVGRVAAAVEEAFQRRLGYDIEYRLRRGRDTVWVNERGTPSYDAQGQPQWIDAVILDISAEKAKEVKLHAASIYARNLLEVSLDPLVTISVEGKITDVNAAVEKITGRTREQLIGSDFSEYFTEPVKARAGYLQAFSVGQVVDFPLSLRQPSGEVVDVLYNASVYRNQNGEVAGVFAAARDVTQFNRSRAALEAKNREIQVLGRVTELLQSCQSADEAWPIIRTGMLTLFPVWSGAVYVLSESGALLEQVCAWGGMAPANTDFSPTECWSLRRGVMHERIGADDLSPRCAHLTEAESDRVICMPLLAQGKTLGLLVLRPDHGAAGVDDPHEASQLVRSVAENFSLSLANLQLRESLRALSLRDPLTGLFNRRFMEETLAREISRASRGGKALALAMLDLDHFKRFNDSYGHEAGDAVLKAVAELLQHFRLGTDVACRFGGEELVLILPEIPPPLAVRRLEDLRAQVEALQVVADGKAVGRVTVSIGLALFPLDGSEAGELLKAADLALYQAKHEGRNRLAMSGAVREAADNGNAGA